MGKGAKKESAGSESRISDPRFASFETDPRFRLPSKKKTKTTLGKRFSHMLNDDEFTAQTRVDRYGRKVKSDSKKKALQALYQKEEDDEEEDDDEDEDKEEQEDNIEVEDDDVVQRELLKAHEKYDPARGGGFSSSEDDSDSDSDSDEDEEDGGVELPAAGDMQKLQDESAEVEEGEVTNRIAIVNLDWDHVKSTDLFALFSSFLPAEAGKVERVSVYPSEFGKERMRQEEVEGPPKALFKNEAKDDDEESDSESDSDEKIKNELMQEGNDEDFDSDALRAYQLDRLRYYYAVMTCSSPAAAKKIYDATDGTEFQSSSNFLDLRFVPDDVTFDDEPRDECDHLSNSYKPIEFVTNALQSSKVKLTWDIHPEEISRKDAVNRAFTGSRNQLDENDLRAYLASDSEAEPEADDDEDEEPEAAQAEEDAPKLSKKELARKKMREALGLSEEPTAKSSSKGRPVGDMEITFTPALSESKPKKDEKEETTIEKYKRKEKERKEKKREKARAKREGRDPDAEEDSANEGAEMMGGLDGEGDEEDLGFDDPFFTADVPAAASKSSIRKEERLKKRAAREAADAESAAQKAHLAKVMADHDNENDAADVNHFDMNDILKAEKLKGKKGKAKKRALAKVAGGDGENALQSEFQVDVDDERFKAGFESHEFAIDPSNPKYKETEGMKKLRVEGMKKRRGEDGGEDRGAKKAKKTKR